MASAQVSSKSVKSQEHLEAGRRRLEEFRKKKGGKKSVAASQPRTTNPAPAEKQASEHGPAPVDSVGPANTMTDVVTPASDFSGYTVNKNDNESETVPQSQITYQSSDFSSPDLFPVLPKRVGSESDIGDGKHEVAAPLGRHGSLRDNSTIDSRSNFYGGSKDVSSTFLPSSSAGSQSVAASVYSKGRLDNLLRQDNKPESVDSVHPSSEFLASNMELVPNQHGMAYKNYLSSNISEIIPTDPVGSLLDFGSQRASEPLSGAVDFKARGPVGGILSSAMDPVTETYSKKTRPSFLDSLNIGRDSPAYPSSRLEKENYSTSKLPSSDLTASSWVQSSATTAPVEPLPPPVHSNKNNDYFGNGFTGQHMLDNSMGSKLELSSQKQNEDFAALEQHIEDLTQEKFSLQRSMEASKALAESLAAENTSLTESYNQQASVVSQLNDEMERLHEEIKARLVELETIKAEFTNAHLECNAADERAKLLASEVINLEEKTLRLRSNELKLERELEKSNAEIASYKKKLSSLEKERRDLQQTCDALQEEKKLLQSKLRKASTSDISVDLNKGHSKKDASTSTNDSSNDLEQASSNIQMHDNTDNVLSLLENGSPGFEDVAMIIPPDQVQMMQNISALISEIKCEKDEVTRALINEVSTTAKLKDMNKELSHKLEVQTQRLELLTAQNMASGNLTIRQPTASLAVRETVAYADEGDEVVERVLGWIMKLFPGGPSKRRTSRL